MKKAVIIIMLVSCSVSGLMYSCCKAGSGGKADIVASIAHHGKPVNGATIYIKYGAKEFPGSDLSVYNDHLTAAANSSAVTFKEVKCGNYYLYGVGFDSTINLPVTGGIQLSLKHSERKDEKIISVPVSE